MAKQEKIGAAVSDNIIDQIKARETLFGKEGKTQQDHLSIHSNTAWVKLRSSVNQITNKDADALKVSKDNRATIVGDKTYAENFILVGGTANVGGMRSGISREPNVIDTNKAYQNFERGLGFRPMPGITSLKVASKNTYGTLMQAEVGFTVWSVEDLEICELLYFRPGYTALLEWGHSIYVDNQGNLKQAGPDNQTLTNDRWFSSQRAGAIEDGIQYRREQAGGNYEGMFGYITNFSWSFRSDGGYDCSVKIVSRGVVLESLKNGKTTDVIPPSEIGPGDKEKGKRERKSPYHYIFSRLEQKTNGTMFDGIEQLKDTKANHAATQLEPFKVWRTYQDFENPESWIGREKTINLQYITLRTVLDIFNKFCTLKDTANNNDPIDSFNIEYGKKYFTYNRHYSIDPVVALLPHKSIVSWLNVTRGKLHDSVEEELKKEENGGTDDILNILVSTKYVEGELDAVIDNAQEEGIGFFDVIKGILSKVQNALGEINDFDIAWDNKQHILVDRRALGPDTLPTIQITGLNSTVSSISIDSKITNAISSQVSIAAQGNSGNYADNISAILEWNGGAIDRHLVVKDQSDSETDEEDDEKFEKFLEDLYEVYESFNGTLLNNTVYDAELFNQLRSDNIANIQKTAKTYLASKGEPAKGVVPVELSMTMMGIGGFKVGSSFNIKKGVLPSKYDAYSYIITGMEHNIGTDNKWTTSLKTQFYATRKLENDAKAVAKQSNNVQNNPNSIQNTPPANSSPAVNDLTPIVNPATPNADRLRATLTQLGYREKGQELSNGGDITTEAANMGIAVAKKIKEKAPSASLVFTGGNDKFHQNLPYNSRHKAGRGLDFVVVPATPDNIRKVKSVLQGFAVGSKPNFKFIDEYSNPTKAASGKHFHFSWGPGTEGAKDVKAALALYEAGKIDKYTV